MKFVVSFFLMAIFSFVTCIYFPWWSIAIVVFIIAVIVHQKPGMSFLCGFFSLFLLWTVLSFWLSSNNDHILAHKLSILILRLNNPFALIIFTGLIAGLVGGFAALTASFVRKKEN